MKFYICALITLASLAAAAKITDSEADQKNKLIAMQLMSQRGFTLKKVKVNYDLISAFDTPAQQVESLLNSPCGFATQDGNSELLLVTYDSRYRDWNYTLVYDTFLFFNNGITSPFRLGQGYDNTDKKNLKLELTYKTGLTTSDWFQKADSVVKFDDKGNLLGADVVISRNITINEGTTQAPKMVKKMRPLYEYTCSK